MSSWFCRQFLSTFEYLHVQEAQRAREEGERRRKERGYDRRYRDRYRDKYRKVSNSSVLQLFVVFFIFQQCLVLIMDTKFWFGCLVLQHYMDDYHVRFNFSFPFLSLSKHCLWWLDVVLQTLLNFFLKKRFLMLKFNSILLEFLWKYAIFIMNSSFFFSFFFFIKSKHEPFQTW